MKISIAQTVSNLAEQVQMFVQEKRTRGAMMEGESRMKKWKESKLWPQQLATPTFTATLETPSVISLLTYFKSESVDPQGPPVSLISLVTRLTPTNRGPVP
ncbi:hypothetical protein Adt_39415 [Abeliophyllum distichum]|uniref:Uncharacterized protein n=1 Tax=Abeliophyllum distichum TaxID=126358 RepID=A0ABD1Q825_9LAMI